MEYINGSISIAADKWEKIGIKTKDGTVNGVAPVIVSTIPKELEVQDI